MSDEVTSNPTTDQQAGWQAANPPPTDTTAPVVAPAPPDVTAPAPPTAPPPAPPAYVVIKSADGQIAGWAAIDADTLLPVKSYAASIVAAGGGAIDEYDALYTTMGRVKRGAEAELGVAVNISVSMEGWLQMVGNRPVAAFGPDDVKFP